MLYYHLMRCTIQNANYRTVNVLLVLFSLAGESFLFLGQTLQSRKPRKIQVIPKDRLDKLQTVVSIV